MVADELAGRVVETIREHAQTGKTGDGKILVLELGQAVRSRTGEAKGEAL